MSLPVRDQLRYWGIAAAVFLVLLWALGDVILPFLLGGALAYCLDPIADFLERRGLSRVWATITITLLAAIGFVLASLVVIPTLVQQAAGLVETAPRLIAEFQDFLLGRFPELMDGESRLSRSLASLGSSLQERGGALLNSLINSALSVINILVLAVLVPVVTFYLLMDWDRMLARIDDLLPRDHAPVVRRLARDIDTTLAAFIRGQGTVCLIQGSYYGIALMLVGLQFGLVIGFFAGLISFIPYVGALVGGVLAIGLALFQFWGQWVWIGAVAAIFFIGQFIEGNVLTPKLVGNSVGLHPVWLIFALSAFGTVFGFVGMLVAVPVAAAIGVLARFVIDRYRDSRLFRGQADNKRD